MWEVIKSVLAAFFGVQKESRRQRDFEHGKPKTFVAVGVAMGGLLVILMATVAIMAAR